MFILSSTTVWSNLPNQGVVQPRGVGRISVQGCQTSPNKMLLRWFLDVAGQGMWWANLSTKESPAKPNRFRNSLEIFNTIFQSFEGILFFSPLYGTIFTPLTTLSFCFIYLVSGPSFQVRNEERIRSLEESENVKDLCPDVGVTHQ